SLDNFARPRASGIIAVELNKNDELVAVAITDGQRDVLLFASNGKTIRFREGDVRPMGRNAAGVRGIQLTKGERVVGVIIVGQGDILTATENGYGKRTPVEDYPVQGRGGQGVISIQTTERNGKVVGAIQVPSDAEIMLISNGGTLVRTPVSDISIVGRNTQGVRLIRLGEGEQLVGIDRIEADDGEDNGNGS
ncbi:MAG: DNA gyrase C-terminal beta-propeller domain-containing protein, partial [Rhodanobacteraceae bacterium]